MTEKKNIPKLRFPEFSDDRNKSYKKHSFSDIFLFSTGKNIKQNEASPDFETPCVRYGELYYMYNEVITKVFNKTNLDKSELLLSKGDEILLPSAGEDPLDIGSASALTIENVAIGRTINILKPFKDNVYSQIYVAYYINQKLRKKISTLAKGSSISNVYNSDLKTLKIMLPNLSEQTKIANFLTAVDEKIQALKEKKRLLEEYKKGLMQNIFSQEIRFKNDDGSYFDDWDEKTLGEICKLQGGYAFKSNLFRRHGIPVVRISNISNYNNHIDFRNIVYYDKLPNANNFTIKKGDLIMAMSGATTGKSSIYNLDFDSYLNQRVGLFKSKTNELYYKYLIQFVFSESFIKQLETVLVAGAQPNVSSSDIESFIIPFPSLSEQQKIANFLTSIDQKIEKLGQQIEDTQTFKIGLLQQMFV